jgi:uncharacterized membrane protein (UPF0127 family)
MRPRRRSSPVLRLVAVAALVALVAGGCSSRAASGGQASSSTSLAGPAPGQGGFGTVRVLVRTASGELQWCMLLAATPAQRERGLMEVTDPALNGFDGMLFRYSTDDTGQFWMRNTPMPLSLAYIDRAGRLVSATDMAPCGDRSDCPTYPSTGPFRTVVEVPQGRLDDLGIDADATVVDTMASC